LYIGIQIRGAFDVPLAALARLVPRIELLALLILMILLLIRIYRLVHLHRLLVVWVKLLFLRRLHEGV